VPHSTPRRRRCLHQSDEGVSQTAAISRHLDRLTAAMGGELSSFTRCLAGYIWRRPACHPVRCCLRILLVRGEDLHAQPRPPSPLWGIVGWTDVNYSGDPAMLMTRTCRESRASTSVHRRTSQGAPLTSQTPRTALIANRGVSKFICLMGGGGGGG